MSEGTQSRDPATRADKARAAFYMVTAGLIVLTLLVAYCLTAHGGMS